MRTLARVRQRRWEGGTLGWLYLVSLVKEPLGKPQLFSMSYESPLERENPEESLLLLTWNVSYFLEKLFTSNQIMMWHTFALYCFSIHCDNFLEPFSEKKNEFNLYHPSIHFKSQPVPARLLQFWYWQETRKLFSKRVTHDRMVRMWPYDSVNLTFILIKTRNTIMTC